MAAGLGALLLICLLAAAGDAFSECGLSVQKSDAVHRGGKF